LLRLSWLRFYFGNAMSEKERIISVWFFVGALLMVYGLIILVTGLFDWSRQLNVVLEHLHAPVWWGALLILIGLVFCAKFRGHRS
jgi:hypothetical protein